MINTIREKTGGGIREIYRVLDLPRSSYGHAATEAPTLSGDRGLSVEICEIFKSRQWRYGYRRIASELAAR